jgi:hypothetical protein
MAVMRSPLYVLAFLLILGVPQLAAFAMQFNLGFRPFMSEPTRVPLSWDMFSNRVDRCVVKWSSPLQMGAHTISSLRDVELPLEWDIIFDEAGMYRAASESLCRAFATGPNETQLHCYFNNGTETQDAFKCH